ncbi:CcdB family protein [Cronobacter dublinensis]
MQYQIYRNTSTNKKYPYLIDVQSDLIDVLTTRVVIPLVPRFMAQKPLPERMCPVVEVDGDEYIVMTHEMASVAKVYLASTPPAHYPGVSILKTPSILCSTGFDFPAERFAQSR